MTDEQFAQLLAAVNRLADSADRLVDSADRIAESMDSNVSGGLADTLSEAFFPIDVDASENFGGAMKLLAQYLKARRDGD